MKMALWIFSSGMPVASVGSMKFFEEAPDYQAPIPALPLFFPELEVSERPDESVFVREKVYKEKQRSPHR